MPLWIPSPATEPDEQVAFSALADHLTSGWRAIGGRVIVTDRRLLFTPNRVDGLTGGRPFALERRDITQVTVESPGLQAAWEHGVGALLRPFVVVAHQAGRDLFLVNRPGRLTSALEGAAG